MALMMSGVCLRGLSSLRFYEGVWSLTFGFRFNIKVVQPWKDIWLWGKHDRTHETLVKRQGGRGAQFMLHLNLQPFFLPKMLEFKFLFETFVLLRLKTSPAISTPFHKLWVDPDVQCVELSGDFHWSASPACSEQSSALAIIKIS